MGKHEAPSGNRKAASATRTAPRHAAPAQESGGLRLPFGDLKLPEIRLPRLSELPTPQRKRTEAPAPETEESVQAPTPAPEKKDFGPTRVWDRDELVKAVVEESGNDDNADETDVDDVKIYKVPERPVQPTAAEESEDLEESEDFEEAEEAADEAPDRKMNLSLPKIDWEAIRSFFERVSRFGMKGDPRAEGHRRSYAFDRNQVALAAGSALVFFVLSLLPTRGWVRFVLYLIPFAALAVYTVLDAVGELFDRVIPGRNLLVGLAAIGLLCLGDAPSAVFVLLIHRLLILLEAWLYEKREATLDALDALIPDKALTESPEGLVKKDPKDFEPGDVLFVPAGERVALDGVVLEGISSLDASALCGEGEVLDVGVNSRVFAGCRNTTKPLRVRVTERWADSTVQRCVARAKKAAASEPARAALPEKLLAWLPLGLSVLGVLLGLIASIVTHAWSVWLGRGFLLIALAGCGDLLLSARMAYFTGVTDAVKKGMSFIDAEAVDRFAGSDMMIFSKTGTVTEGQYSVVAVYPVDYEEKDLLTIAALAECQSTHPIAVALREALGIEIHHRSDITLLEETPGRGIHALFGGRNVYVGNSTLLIDHNIVFDVPSHKGTVIHIAVDNKYAGCIVLNDRIRDGAFDAVEELRLRGIRAAVMLTGDVRSMARPIASSLNFDMVKCELSNESKLEALNYLRDSKGNSAAISYVSSKDEDLELLQAADVGVGFAALTERGLIENASVLVMSKKIFQIPQALFMAKRISFAALLDALIMLGLELLLIVLGLCGVIGAWLALLLLLLGRVGTLAYSIYFK